MVTKLIMPIGLSATIAVTAGGAFGAVGGLLYDQERRSRHHHYS